jgi:hypothetical protein
MAHSVEEKLVQMLGEAKGGGLVEGQKEYKLLKERNVSADVGYTKHSKDLIFVLHFFPRSASSWTFGRRSIAAAAAAD